MAEHEVVCALKQALLQGGDVADVTHAFHHAVLRSDTPLSASLRGRMLAVITAWLATAADSATEQARVASLAWELCLLLAPWASFLGHEREDADWGREWHAVLRTLLAQHHSAPERVMLLRQAWSSAVSDNVRGSLCVHLGEALAALGPKRAPKLGGECLRQQVLPWYVSSMPALVRQRVLQCGWPWLHGTHVADSGEDEEDQDGDAMHGGSRHVAWSTPPSCLRFVTQLNAQLAAAASFAPPNAEASLFWLRQLALLASYCWRPGTMAGVPSTCTWMMEAVHGLVLALQDHASVWEPWLWPEPRLGELSAYVGAVLRWSDAWQPAGLHWMPCVIPASVALVQWMPCLVGQKRTPAAAGTGHASPETPASNDPAGLPNDVTLDAFIGLAHAVRPASMAPLLRSADDCQRLVRQLHAVLHHVACCPVQQLRTSAWNGVRAVIGALSVRQRWAIVLPGLVDACATLDPVQGLLYGVMKEHVSHGDTGSVVRRAVLTALQWSHDADDARMHNPPGGGDNTAAAGDRGAPGVPRNPLDHVDSLLTRLNLARFLALRGPCLGMTLQHKARVRRRFLQPLDQDLGKCLEAEDRVNRDATDVEAAQRFNGGLLLRSTLDRVSELWQQGEEGGGRGQVGV